jgi:Nodulation protein Z (NodZ)
MGARYVVAKHCFAGIGDHLLCVIGAWLLAKRTGRVLVIDWRGSRFNHDPAGGRNCFQDYFAPVESLGGVKVIADDSVGQIDFPLPIWPDKWSRTTLAGVEHLKHTAPEIAELHAILNSNDDPSAPTFVLNGWPEPASMPAEVRDLLNDLRFADQIRNDVDIFWNKSVRPSPAVAIHLRHGNGENIGNRAAYWLGPVSLARQLVMNSRNDIHRPGLAGRFSDNAADSLVGTPAQARAERHFCRRVAAEVESLAARAAWSNTVPILFCDSAQIIATMREVLPTLAVRPKRLLAPGNGPLHQFASAEGRQTQSGGVRGGAVPHEITRDMFAELELMGRCSGLVYMDSGFSILSRIRLEKNRQIRLGPTMVNKFLTKAINRLTRH